MSYKTYITEAVVCGSEDRNTADRSYLLFTRDAGMLYATAKSVRKEESKHRYALQDASYLRVTLVRGKSGWRIIGTEPLGNFYAKTTTREARRGLRGSILLLKRLVRGEVPYPEIFDDLLSVGQTLDAPHDLFELVFTLRVLNTLGYVAPETSYAHLLSPAFPHEALTTMEDEVRKVCDEATKRALTESQL